MAAALPIRFTEILQVSFRSSKMLVIQKLMTVPIAHAAWYRSMLIGF